MSIAKFNEWLQVAGFFGIIASLVFVGLEMQQSRQTAIADIYQQRTAMLIQVQTTQFVPEQYQDVRIKDLMNEPLSILEEQLLQYGWLPWFAYWENNHFQYQMGLLSEEQWQSSRNTMRNWVRRPGFEAWWVDERSSQRESFAQAVDEVIEEEKAKQ